MQVYLVPGDTFRAAAAEQLAEWAKRANVTVGAFQDKAKPQKVIAQVYGVDMGVGQARDSIERVNG